MKNTSLREGKRMIRVSDDRRKQNQRKPCRHTRVADCADYETYRSGKFIPGIMGTLFSLVDKLVSSLSATVVSVALLFVGVDFLPTKEDAYVPGMNWVVIVLFCVIPMCAWLLMLWAMKGYELDGQRVKTIQKVNNARRQAVANGMTMEEVMVTITDETV